MPRKYLVTGGAGFIGSHLVRTLLKRGDSVRVLDNLSSGKKENLQDVMDKIQWMEGSIEDENSVHHALKNIDVIFHLAAMVSVPMTVEKPLLSNQINIGGTLNLLEGARKEGIRRFVLASSAAAYGENPTPAKGEYLLPEPISPYGVQKVCGEMYLKAYHKMHNMATISLRFFNVYGPRQDPSSDYAAVIPKFISRMAAGKAPVIFGDGQQSRDFVSVEDVVQANLLAAEAPEMAWGKVFNVGTGKAIDLNRLASLLNEILKTSFQPVYEAPRPGDILHSLADISAIQEHLSYTPKISFPEGLQKTVEWFLQPGKI